MTTGPEVQAAEARKHTANDQKSTELGWSCVTLAVESYGAWGKEAQEFFTILASPSSKSKTTLEPTEPGSDYIDCQSSHF